MTRDQHIEKIETGPEQGPEFLMEANPV